MPVPPDPVVANDSFDSLLPTFPSYNPMPSLFSRARTISTTQKKANFNSDENNGVGTSDEFGRVSSRQSNRGGPLVSPSSKKDKKKDQKRSKALPSGQDEPEQVLESLFPDGAFLPLNLERPRSDGGATEYLKEHDYGYLSYERHVVLGLEQAERLVEVISEELETRGGVTTPFIFSTTALDISSSAIKRIIRSFLNTCEHFSGQKAQEAEAQWREEARFAGPHELGMCLRWGLARVIRSVSGQDVRGLVSWEHYVEFRESEATYGYPPTHFATNFLPTLAPPLQAIIIRLLSLLARLVANSTRSGHTPPTLSPLFGPLFFGLGPATLAFHHAYIHYLRSVNAMEHLILAFVRWQDTPRISSSSPAGHSASAASLGVPVRLKEWIKGYPAMLSFDLKKPQPRRGARTVRVVSVRRNVRMYSPDLVRTASTWAYKPPGSNITKGLAGSKEWDRIAPATLKLAPRYSEGYKKRMDMLANFHPEVAPGTGPELKPSQSASSYLSSTLSATPSSSTNASLPDPDYFGIGVREGEDRFRSLTDLKWGEFESMGFSGLGDEKKLQFDLTETARTERTAKRQTLSWNDFSSAGFTRMDAPLSATLQFSTPITNTISTWPSQNAEISRKLKKTHKALPAFGWDTEPVIGSEEVIEEAFLDVFCDLIYGGGWMDLERGEMLDRDCNWALVEYKSLPPSRTTASGGSDPRTTNTLILFEEFVPLEYREQLAIKSSSRRRLPSLFSASGKKQWKQAATLNGRPYVVGHVPHSPSYREVEFEGLLHGTTSTKVLSLNSKPPTHIRSAVMNHPPERRLPLLPMPAIAKTPPHPMKLLESESHPAPRSDEIHSDSTASPSIKKSLFRLPATPGSNRKSMIPAEYSTVEFETRMASYSDDELNGSLNEPEDVKQKRRESSTDAWVDILVGSQTRRFGGQDAEFNDRKRGPLNRHSDPDIAGLEVAQVLASVQNRSPSPSSMMERVDQDFGMDQHYKDLDIDEVETVPRTSNARSDETDEDDNAGLPYDESEQGHGDVETNLEIGAMNARQMARYQRRLGYFDLHPERRQAVGQSVIDEDNVRAKLSKDDSDEDDENDERIYGPPEVRPLPAPPVAPPTIHEPAPLVPAKSAVSALNKSAEVKSDNISAPLPPTNGLPVTPSKTAALIEMYRERERGTPPKPVAPVNPVPIVIAPLAPSRLPVRSASLAKDNSPQPQPPLLAPSPNVSPQPSPPEPTLIDLPRIPLEETGRNSPARYQHGAPLHNVIEEEEE